MKTITNKRFTVLFSALSAFGALGAARAAEPVTAPPAPDAATRIAWWQDAKFGLFIHWGPVSVAGTEIGWSRQGERRGRATPTTGVPVERYDNLYKEFNPVRYDATEWAAIAKAAGMKYVVLTTRHHDGFSLWDTQASDYKITSLHSPYGKDLVRPLAEATRAAGLRFGVYYSQPDWYHPDAYTERHDAYKNYLASQLRELMTGYGRIDIAWFDGLGKPAADYGSIELNRMIRELQPQILINDRNAAREDFSTPEQRVGGMNVVRPWETNMTICRQWAWKPDDTMKSLDDCLRILVTTVTGGGNLLLNVGPMPDGRIEPRQVERLKEIGAWMEQNGTAIYRTRGGPWANGSWGGSTYRDNKIFVHLLQNPALGRLKLAALPHAITAARLLNGGASIPFTQTDTAVTLELGQAAFRSPVTILELTTAEPVKPGQVLGRGASAFDDTSAFGKPCQAEAQVTVTSGEAKKEADGRWTVKTGNGNQPGAIFDLSSVRELTAFSALSVDHSHLVSNVDLCLALSLDGKTWTEVYRGNYGLPKWEVPLTSFVAGIDQPGRPARYLRVWIDNGKTNGALTLGKVTLYAR
jgi:alpha-L-fucosidase